MEDQISSLRIELSNVEEQREQMEDQITSLRTYLSNVEEQSEPLRAWLSFKVIFF